jgi:hypothetical protein
MLHYDTRRIGCFLVANWLLPGCELVVHSFLTVSINNETLLYSVVVVCRGGSGPFGDSESDCVVWASTVASRGQRKAGWKRRRNA